MTLRCGAADHRQAAEHVKPILARKIVFIRPPAWSSLAAPRMSENFYQKTTSAPVTSFDVSLRPPVFSEFIGQE